MLWRVAHAIFIVILGTTIGLFLRYKGGKNAKKTTGTQEKEEKKKKTEND